MYHCHAKYIPDDKEDHSFMERLHSDNAQPGCTRCTRAGLDCVREIRFKTQAPFTPLTPSTNRGDQDDGSKGALSTPRQPFVSGFVDENQNLSTRVEKLQRSKRKRNALSASDGPGLRTEGSTTEECRSSFDDSYTTEFPEGGGHQSALESAYDDEHDFASPQQLASLRRLGSTTSEPEEIEVSEELSSLPGTTIDYPSSPGYLLGSFNVSGIGTTRPWNFRISTTSHYTPDETTITSTPRLASNWPLRDPDEVKLMRYFVDNVARRFDLCDPERHFALVVPWRAAFCQHLLDAAFALSARCLSRTTNFDPYVSNKYYQRCLNELIPRMGGPDSLKDQDLFAAVVLLRTLEEIDFPLAGADSHTHLFGGHLFISASDSDQQSCQPSPPNRPADSLTGLRRASSLVAFRQEVYTAFVTQRPVNEAFCLKDIDRSLDDSTDECTWTNRVLLQLADTLDFCYGSHLETAEDSIQRHKLLWDQSEQWYLRKPPSFDPVAIEATQSMHPETSSFRSKMWILSDAAATGLLNYHLLRILLLSFDPQMPRIGPSRARIMKQQDQKIKEEVITLIALANGNESCPPHFVLACMGIAIAGDRFEDRWEQDELMTFLKKTESVHAWSTLAAQKHLVEAWSHGD